MLLTKCMCSFFTKNSKVLIIKMLIKFQIFYAFKALLKLLTLAS